MTSNRDMDRDKGIQESNDHVKDRDQNGVAGDAHKSSELRINQVYEAVKNGHGQLVQGQISVQDPERQPQGSLLWERFLNVRSIKVMLVENDDSTRHILTALLRNSNYEVIEASNGMQAWKFLEDLTNHVDIVLTEVSMPHLSGANLLCRIMSHKTRKNIPVIMMSSQDSMGLVFKCLTKGAVDFLVKPIRKNELKNLWQHVWRKCRSSSGSGSESGTQTQKSVKANSNVRSDMNGDNNDRDDDDDDDESNGLDTSEGSDYGSATQSSWTNQSVKSDSSQAVSPRDKKSESQISTQGHVIRPNTEAPGTQDIHRQEQLDNVVGKSRHSRDGECSTHNYKADGSYMLDYQKDEAKVEVIKEPVNLEVNSIHDEPNEGAVIELSLKRLREVKDTGRAGQYDRNASRHSELTTFSRYNTTTNASKAPNGITRSSSQLDDRLDVTKKAPMRDFKSHSDGGQQLLSKPDNFFLNKLTAEGLNCGSSNALDELLLESIPGKCSLNRSASDIKYGSNNIAVNAGGANMDSEVGIVPENENDSGSGSGNRSDKAKFRQKRKTCASKRRCDTKTERG